MVLRQDGLRELSLGRWRVWLKVPLTVVLWADLRSELSTPMQRLYSGRQTEVPLWYPSFLSQGTQDWKGHTYPKTVTSRGEPKWEKAGAVHINNGSRLNLGIRNQKSSRGTGNSNPLSYISHSWRKHVQIWKHWTSGVPGLCSVLSDLRCTCALQCTLATLPSYLVITSTHHNEL